MGGRAYVLLGLVALAGLATASAPVAGELHFADVPRVKGNLRLAGPDAVLDLAHAAAIPRVSWERAEGWLVEREWSAVAPAGQYVLARQVGTRNVTLAYEAGTIDVRACGECVVLFVATPRGEIAASAHEGAPLARLADPVAFGAAPESGEGDHYEVEVPAGAALLAARSTPQLAGEVVLILDNASAAVETSRGREELWTGQRAESGPATRTIVERYAVLRLHGARIDAAAVDGARLLAPTATWSVEGNLVSERASGWLRVGGERHELRDNALSIDGTLRIATRPGAAVALLSATPRDTLAGEATRVSVGGEVVASERLAPPNAGATASFALLGLLVIALLPAYTRIRQEELLLHPTRRRLYDTISREPGVNVAELVRRLGVAEGVVRHHLAILERRRLVATRLAEGTRAAFLVEAIPRAPWAPAPRGARRLIGDAIAERALTQAEIADRTGLSQRLVSYHLGRMAKRGELRIEAGRPARYQRG